MRLELYPTTVFLEFGEGLKSVATLGVRCSVVLADLLPSACAICVDTNNTGSNRQSYGRMSPGLCNITLDTVNRFLTLGIEAFVLLLNKAFVASELMCYLLCLYN